MGRHSIPDPEDSADDESSGYADDGGSEPQYGDSDHGLPDHLRTGDPDSEDEEPAGPQRSGGWESGEWTGSHRAVAPGRRGVSKGIIAALVAVVVAVAAVIVWRFFGDALSNRSDAAAARCVKGDLAVSVIADPSIADQVQALAGKYNTSADPVGDRCVRLGVKPAESDQVVNGFSGDWPAELGERPALWIPASSVSEARLEAAAGAGTISDSRSLVSTPVLLAIRPELKDALSDQNWGSLPTLQSDPAALDNLNLPGWGSLKLSLPLSADADASYLAAEAVASASAPAGAPADAGLGAVNALTAGQPNLADNKASTAMDALLNATDPATAPVHAVVTTEHQLFQRGAALPDAKSTVTSWIPSGPTPVADYPTVLLNGDWLSQEQMSAASEFARFIRKPEQIGEFAKAGFRTEGATPPHSDVTAFAPVDQPLSVGDNSARANMANALTTPAKSPAVTIMLDQSMPAQEGAQSRLGNVVTALSARLVALPPTSAIGLWTFDGTAGRSAVPIGPLFDPVAGQPRSAVLNSTLGQQSASGGGAVSFTTLRLAYSDALTNYREGQQNSVLVITTGPHTDQTLDGQGLRDFIQRVFDPARPVAVNVIDFGGDSDQPTWEAVAQTTGGGYQSLASSDSPELNTAVAKFVA